MVGDYRKKPVVIQAVQFTADAPSKIEEFLPKEISILKGGELYIRTLEGDLHVSANDWVIRGVRGEFYPCKPDIFEATYEKV